MSIVLYFLKASLIQLVLLGVYRRWLEDEYVGQWKRIYLMGTLLLSFVLPLLVVRTITAVPETLGLRIIEDAATLPPVIVAVSSALLSPKTASGLLPGINGLSGYQILGSILVGGWLIGGIFQLRILVAYLLLHRSKLKRAVIRMASGYRLATLPGPTHPHTFGNTVFVDDVPEAAILLHEATHARQWHSADRVLLQLIRCVCWFLPQLKAYERALVLVHETLADRAVLRQGIPLANYQYLLLNALTAPENRFSLASGFDFSITKKRFLMMTSPSANRPRLLTKLLLTAGLLAGLALITGQTVHTQETTDPPKLKTNMMGKFINRPSAADLEKWTDRSQYCVWLDNEVIAPEKLKDIDLSEVAFYSVLALKPESRFYADHQYQVVIRNHQYLNDRQHQSGQEKQGEYYAALAERSDLEAEQIKSALRVDPKHPTDELLTSWLCEKTYAVWIDGKRIKNSGLLNFSVEDFFYYNVSKLARNAINYGKHDYQVDLMTEQTFLEFQRTVQATPPKQ